MFRIRRTKPRTNNHGEFAQSMRVGGMSRIRRTKTRTMLVSLHLRTPASTGFHTHAADGRDGTDDDSEEQHGHCDQQRR